MRTHGIPRKALAAALACALAPAFAQDEEAERKALTRPDSTAEVGLGAVSDRGLRFGQYNGLDDEGFYGLLGVDINRRDDATGTWLRLRGRNLGLDNRDLRFEHERQGRWGYFIDFSQTPRLSPYIVNTTLGGIGTANMREGALPASDVRLETRRDALTVGLKSNFGAGLDAAASLRHEQKDGTRLWGQASSRFLAEPIDYETNQLEGTVGYAGEKLQLQLGYYGTTFQNANQAVFLTQANGTLAGNTPVSLPPDNSSHQFSLAGGYSFTQTTRAMFKAAYGRIRQEDTFFRNVAPLTVLTTRENLDGRIDNTLLQAGIASRPMPRLGLRADLRYEDRHDKTPIDTYVTAAPTATHNGQNEPRSFRNVIGKAEASYLLPADFRLTGGLEREDRKRNTAAVRSVSHRDETNETTFKLDLRRSLSETVNGAISFARSDREGSDWLFNVRNNGTNGSNLIHPLHLADRDRDKVRLTIDWSATEQLSLQFVGEASQDEYSGRTLGPREGSASFLSLDAAYTFSEAWQAFAWASRMDTRAEQQTCLNAPASPATIGCPAAAPATGVWEARLQNVGEALGIGVKGKPSAVLHLGAELSWTKDRGEFEQLAITPGIVAPAIPDAVYTHTTLKLQALYATSKTSGLRLQYIYDRYEVDDWYWTGWVYADSGVPASTVRQDPVQTVHFLGASYYIRF